MTSGSGLDGPPPLEVGADLVPGYVVVAHLRRGADLDVYDLCSEERGCRCIGKTLRPDRLQERGARTRLLKEGRLLLRLTHPHIVRAYEVIEEPATALILETLPGETLAHLIERRTNRLPAAEIAQLGLQLSSAVAYLHRQGTLHLDLKPSNIIVTHGLTKVLDLSLARPPGRYRGGSGTAGYMAPEQIVGGEIGPPADVWGIGAALYEVAAGEAACDAGDESESASADVSKDICCPEPVSRVRRLPQSLAAAIDGCLNVDPKDRPTLPGLTTHLERVIASRSRHPC